MLGTLDLIFKRGEPGDDHHGTTLAQKVTEKQRISPLHPVGTKRRPKGYQLTMTKRIVVLDADLAQCQEIRILLSSLDVAAMHSLPELQEYLTESDCRVILIDLDTIAIDNRTLVQMKRQHPEIDIIAKSEHPFHPELEEALRSHILACLTKPLDPDELIFWLKSIFQNSSPPDKSLNQTLS
jgi:DNA-binding NtrC family response regulator